MSRTMQTAKKSTGGVQDRVVKRRATRAEKLELSHPQNKLTRFQAKLLETQSFPLMKLPLELREMVYLHAMMPASSSQADPRIKAHDYIVDEKRRARLNLAPVDVNNSMAILRANQEIHREAIEVFQKKFIFRLDSLRCSQTKSIPHPIHYKGLRKVSIVCHLRPAGGRPESTEAVMISEGCIRYWARMLTGLRQVEMMISVYPYDINAKGAEAAIVRMAKAFKDAGVTIKLDARNDEDGEVAGLGKLFRCCRQKIAQHKKEYAKKQQKIGVSDRVLRPRGPRSLGGKNCDGET